ncbi:DUF262 domain-containing protein [Mycoplasmopsis californica]|uniref:DUF262 domain-containing protein n=1 Tax=Mycoplasmopsis californica TaxID=2113 RepID=UPI000F62AB21|nr:DUF262 domain-containing protein [Mycoplasmopsis californica]
MKSNEEMSKHIKKNFKEWKIGTDVYTYLKKSVIPWLRELNEDEIILQKENIEGYKYYFENHPNIIFYKANKEYLDEKTLRQLMDVLSALKIVVNTRNLKYQVNQELIDLCKTNINLSSQQIVKEFIIQKFGECSREYFTNILFDTDDNENKTDTKNNFWWTIINIIDSKYMNGKLNSIYSNVEKISDNATQYYVNFIKYFLCDEQELNNDIFNSFNEIIKNITKTLKKPPTLWEESIVINKNYFKNFIDIDQSKNAISIEFKKINNLSDDNKNLLLIKTNIFDFFTSKYANYQLPLFQRTYSWDANIIIGFFDSLFNDYKENQRFSLLNSIILTNVPGGDNQIIDGQQRIASLIIIIFALCKMYKYCQYKKEINDVQIDDKVRRLLSNPINNIFKLLDEFKQNDSNYQVLLDIVQKKEYLKENDDIKNSSFYRNWKEIISLISEKIEDSGEIYGFLEYIMYKTFFALTYIFESNPKNIAKIFCNLNKYSKKLGALDLFRNRLHDFFTSGKEELIQGYNNSINLYFRQKNKSTNDEDETLIQNFLNSVLAKYKKFENVNKIDKDFNDKITNSYEKFNLLLDYYTSDNSQNDGASILKNIWNDILEFEYSLSGAIENAGEVFEKVHKNNELINNLNEATNNFKNKIDSHYINFQIHHLSKRKTVFIPLVWLIAHHLKLFNTNSKNNKKEIDGMNIVFSKYLVQIEKFSILWWSKFKGQSLTKSIIKICRDDLIKNNKLIKPEDLYDKLEEMIPELSREYSKAKKIKNLYIILNETFINYNKTPENNSCKYILGRLAYSLGQGKSVATPQYFTGYVSDDDRNSSIDFIPYTYDHTTLPQKLRDKDKTLFRDVGVENLETIIENTTYQIGNGSLKTQRDNSKKGNRLDSDNAVNVRSNITIKGSPESNFNIIDFDELDNDKILTNKATKIELPEIIQDCEKFIKNNQKPQNSDQKVQIKEYFEKLPEKISQRSEKIIKSYISSLFYDWIEEDN